VQETARMPTALLEIDKKENYKERLLLYGGRSNLEKESYGNLQKRLNSGLVSAFKMAAKEL